MPPRAIETQFKGFKTRSRLEARWMVFFDSLGAKFEYEPEGFDLGEAGRYLPDFWLPEHRYWIEIKPAYPDTSERRKLQALGWQADGEVFLFDRPDFQVPEINRERCEFLGAWGRRFSQYASLTDDEGDSGMYWVQCTDCIMEGRSTFGISGSDWLVQHMGTTHGWSPKDTHAISGCDETPALVQAYLAARQARFEFGESGSR